MPQVSVIVPVYGVENYLDKCIQSIISQSYKDWELILVDDGSPDKSGEICDKYATEDYRVKVLHTQNGGVSKARNRGIAVAKGMYMTFVDSDDWVEPMYLESMLQYAGERDIIVCGNVVNDYSDGRPSVRVFDYTEGERIYLDADTDKIVKYKLPENGFPIAKLFSTDIIRNHDLMFDESLSYHEDHLFVLNYLKFVDTVILSSIPYYHYEHRAGNASLSKRHHSAMKMIDASSKLIQIIICSNKRWQIEDKDYMKRLYTFLGLNQLMVALKNASSSEFCGVCTAIRDRFEMFRRYYSPNHSIYKIVPYLIVCRADIFYKIILKWKERHS